MNQKVLIVIFTLLFVPLAVHAQGKLDYPAILTALRSKPPRGSTKAKVLAFLISEVDRRGVDKPLTADREDDLRQAGATNELIDTIRERSPRLAKPNSAPTQTPPLISGVVKNLPEGKSSPELASRCTCPSISISGPVGATYPGKSITFSAITSGATTNFTYNWTVSAGTIVAGHGTTTIVVETTKTMENSSLTAFVELGGVDPDCRCSPVVIASKPAAVGKIPVAIDVDEFGSAKTADVKARVNRFLLQLNNSPMAKGYVMLWGTFDQNQERRDQIMISLVLANFDLDRIVFLFGKPKGKRILTKFILVPEGADVPEIEPWWKKLSDKSSGN